MSDSVVHKMCTSIRNGEWVVFCAAYVCLLHRLERTDNNM